MMVLTCALMMLAAQPLFDPLTPSSTAIFTLMMGHQSHGPSPVVLLLLLQWAPYISTHLHTISIRHYSRVLIVIAMAMVDLADLHPYLSNYFANFSTCDTCIFIIMNGYAKYEYQTHIKQQSNRLGNRFVTGDLWIEAIHLTLCHYLHQFRYCR